MSLLNEFKRRGVFGVAVAYIVVAWLFLQVIDTLTSLLGLPSWLGPTSVLLVVIGFPVAIVLSWSYQVTPDGIALDSELADKGQSQYPRSRRLDMFIIGGLVVALTYFVIDEIAFERTDRVVVWPVAKPLTTLEGIEGQPDVSADGTRVAFHWLRTPNEQADIYVRSIGATDNLQITDTLETERQPSWSPDGNSLAFLRTDNAVRRHQIVFRSLLSKSERIVLETSSEVNGRGLDWSPDGNTLAYVDLDPASEYGNGAIFLVSLSTGERSQFTFPTQDADAEFWGNDLFDGWPTFSPDGSKILFDRKTPVDDLICVQETGSSEARCLNRDSSEVEQIEDYDWMPDSRRIVYVRNREFVSNFRDVVQVSADGNVLQTVVTDPGVVHLSIARNSGTKVISRSFTEHNIWRVRGPAFPKAGEPERIISSTANERWSHYAPDGRRIAFTSDRSGKMALWVANVDGSSLRHLADGHGGWPRWSPDGRHIAYYDKYTRDPNTRGFMPNIFLIEALGGHPARVIEKAAVPSWSKDGKTIYYQRDDNQLACENFGFAIYTFAKDDGTSRKVTTCKNRPLEGPDGRLYFYDHDNDTLSSMPVGGGDIRIDVETPLLVAWDFSDRHLVYIDRTDMWMYVRDLDTGQTRKWIEPYTGSARSFYSAMNSISVTRDGSWIAYTRLDRAGADLMLIEADEKDQ